MITGTHVVIYTTDAEADRAFFRDVLRLESVDAGDGWLVFALPPSKAAFHPAESGGTHELHLTSDNIYQEVASLAEVGVECAPVEEVDWGRVTSIPLPSGGAVGLYEPRHSNPPPRTDATPDPDPLSVRFP